MLPPCFPGTRDPSYCAAGDPNDHHQAGVPGADDGTARHGAAALAGGAGEAGARCASLLQRAAHVSGCRTPSRVLGGRPSRRECSLQQHRVGPVPCFKAAQPSPQQRCRPLPAARAQATVVSLALIVTQLKQERPVVRVFVRVPVAREFTGGDGPSRGQWSQVLVARARV